MCIWNFSILKKKKFKTKNLKAKQVFVKSRANLVLINSQSLSFFLLIKV